MAAIFNGTGKARRVQELKHTPSGTAVLSFAFSQNSGSKDKPVWNNYKVQLWSTRAEALAGKIADGTKFFVSGRQHTEVYKQNDGNVAAVVVIDADTFEFVGDAPQVSQKAEDKKEEEIPF